MSVARDSTAATSANQTADFTFDLTPVGTLKGVAVFIAQETTATDSVNGVTADGVALSRVRFAQDTLTEPMAAYAYFLGSNVPTGTLTIAVDVTRTTENYQACALGMTATGATIEIEASDILQNDVDDPSITLTTGASVETYVVGFLKSGIGVPANITAGTGFTKRVDLDLGDDTACLEDINTNDAGGGVSVPFVTSTVDDVAMIAIAFKEGTVVASHPMPRRVFHLIRR